jgi:hypothetical protein
MTYRLLCIVARDRREMVERCLASVNRLTIPPRVMFIRDPLTTEFDDKWLCDQDPSMIIDCLEDLPPDLPPRQRVARMRCHGFLTAARIADTIFHVDSDVILDRRAIERLEQMSAMPIRHGARSLGNLPQYEQPGYMVERSKLGVSVRSHGLGGCLEFPLTSAIVAAATRGVPRAWAWDTYFSREIAGGRVLTSDVSYARHIGVGTGINASRNPELNWHRFTPELEGIS